MQDLDRIRFVTRYYSALQGLKLVPFGLFLIVMSFRSLGWTGLGKSGDCTYTLPLLVLMFILYFVIGRYYTRRFGEVQPVREDAAWWKGMLPLGILVVAIALETIFLPRFSLAGLALAAMLIYSGIVTRRPHYWVAGAAMIVVSLLPLAVGADPTSQIYGTMGFVWSLTFGIVWTAIGLIDHFVLVRAFKPAAEASDARPE